MSSSSRRTYDTDSIALRRIFAYDISNNAPFSTGFVLTSLTKGSASFVSPTISLSSIGVVNLPVQLSTLSAELLSTAQLIASLYPSSTTYFLPSTVTGLGTVGYISSSGLGSALASSIQGLGTVGYLSTSGLADPLTSTTIGLGTLGYLSSGVVVGPINSTIIGLGTIGYVSTSQLTSTVAGLATSGFLSTSQLTSTVAGLATSGFLSTSQLLSTVDGLGSSQYISSSQLLSTVGGLGMSGYVSSLQLRSTVGGLGNASYISTTQLVSTVQGLGNVGFLSTVNIFRSTYSNVGTGNWSNVAYLFSNVSTNTLSLSTLRFDLGPSLRSKIIPSTTRLDIELKPNLQFVYYDGNSRDYQFNSFLLRGPAYASTNIIGQESLTYYILNASPINLPFFFQEKLRFLVTDPLTLSTLKNDTLFSTLSLHHTFGTNIPATNQFFATPASSICATVVLDNTSS